MSQTAFVPATVPDPATITAYLRSQIPITGAVGLEVTAFDGTTLGARVPFGNNRNHNSSMFGGSLAMLGILSGWSRLWALLRSRGVEANLVIRESATRFLSPTRSEAISRTEDLDPGEVERFFRAFARFGRARLEVRTRIHSEGALVATHRGDFVALRS
ncbi:MAG TPA: YiiD C-terminal domain-containing protein [Planctomycetota bacterium]